MYIPEQLMHRIISCLGRIFTGLKSSLKLADIHFLPIINTE